MEPAVWLSREKLVLLMLVSVMVGFPIRLKPNAAPNPPVPPVSMSWDPSFNDTVTWTTPEETSVKVIVPNTVPAGPQPPVQWSLVIWYVNVSADARVTPRVSRKVRATAVVAAQTISCRFMSPPGLDLTFQLRSARPHSTLLDLRCQQFMESSSRALCCLFIMFSCTYCMKQIASSDTSSQTSNRHPMFL